MDPNADIAAYDKLFGCYSIKIIKSLSTSAFKITKLTILMNMSLEKVQPNAQVLLDEPTAHLEDASCCNHDIASSSKIAH